MNVRLPNESLDQYYARLREKSDREDMVMFVNACFAATSQYEFYSDGQEQSVSIDFLHQYVMANFRTLYARVLSTGINHFNQSLILFYLLRSGAPADPSRRLEEGRLIETALRRLPVNRVLNLIRLLKKHRVNNRRTRATIIKVSCKPPRSGVRLGQVSEQSSDGCDARPFEKRR